MGLRVKFVGGIKDGDWEMIFWIFLEGVRAVVMILGF